MMNFLSYCDGKTSFFEIIKKCKCNVKNIKPIVQKLLKRKIIRKNKFPI